MPSFLAIADELLGTYRVAHPIEGLFAVCDCSIRACGYLEVSNIICRGLIRDIPRSLEVPPREEVADDNNI